MKITAIVLTFNEEIHIERCLKKLFEIVDEIYVIDSFSQDKTIQIADSCGAKILQNKWINHADQFNWALAHIPKSEWILRVDADEYLDVSKTTLNNLLREIAPDCDGVLLKRSIIFQGKKIRFGFASNISILRLFRYGNGVCENRWMDEHIRVRGRVVDSQIAIIDCNLRPLSWWIDKHNHYASLEAVEMLNLEFSFLDRLSSSEIGSKGFNADLKATIKNRVYRCLPTSIRSLAYFFYRYLIGLGFLDGFWGSTFHFLQGFWYRYLVDLKIREVKEYMEENSKPANESVRHVLEIDV